MVSSHAEESDGGQYPKIPRMRNKLATLEKIVEKMTTSLCKHSEKEESLEDEMICMYKTFNTIVDEYKKTANMVTTTLNNENEEWLRIVEDSLKSTATQVKDLEDTINMLKRVVSSRHS
jgi:hypothetical protein